MPYDGPSDSSLPDYIKKLPKSKRAQWVEVFNSAMQQHHDESKAFAMANGVVKGSKSLITDWYDVDSRQLSQQEAEYTPYGADSEGGCANCRWFVSPDACLLVWGDISPTGKSKLWYNAHSPVVSQSVEPVPIVKPEMKEVGPVKKALQSVAKALGFGTKETSPILFTKTSDGKLRFFTSFTNCFKDLHGEVITSVAHKDYVYWATQHNTYPELQLWHSGPQSKFGQVDWLDYSDGFVLASGIIDADKEYIAEALQKENVKVSHGFYGLSNGAKEIMAYRTFEISVLPAIKAANPYTDFNIAKETVMPFSPEKKGWLKTVANMTDEAIGEWEANLTKMSENLKALGIEYKEATGDSIGAEVASYAKTMEAVVGMMTQLKSTVEQNAEAINQLQSTLTKGISEQVESTILAKIAQTPNGFKATESDNNIVSKEKQTKDYSWLLDAIK